MGNRRRRAAGALVGLVAAGMIGTAGVAAADDGDSGSGGGLGGVISGLVDTLTGFIERGTSNLPTVPPVSPGSGSSSPSSPTSPTSTPHTSVTTETETVTLPPVVYGPGSTYYAYVPPVVSVYDLDCGDFADTADAQAVLIGDPSDPNNLDGDNDGRACDRGVGGGDYRGYPTGGVAAGDGSDDGPTVGQVIFLAIAGIGAGAGVVRGGQLVAARRENA
ncbi:hypothetical protein [Actinomycetospora aeridis]|uniref:Excalibur calcium-binding domain-containing protein n=1 Tax=Actinomycetospora aeridis TaxID=3129231 RepID=A0ABU8N1E4_9PSEU